jgi:hypothetical protein
MFGAINFTAPNGNCRAFDGRDDRLMYAGAYPDRISRLAVLDGVTVLPGSPRTPIHERITEWVAQLDSIAEQRTRGYRTIAEAAERMSAHNKRLTPEQALHLASHGVKRNADGGYSWKFDEYQKVRAPYRLAPDDHIVTHHLPYAIAARE